MKAETDFCSMEGSAPEPQQRKPPLPGIVPVLRTLAFSTVEGETAENSPTGKGVATKWYGMGYYEQCSS